MLSNLAKSFSVFASLLLITSPAFAKGKPVDLSAFKGNYSGTLFATEGPSTASGNVTLSVNPAKSGKTVTLNYQGFFSTGSTTMPISCSITLTAKGTSSVSSVLLGIGGVALPATGTAHFGKRNFTFAAATSFSGTTYQLSGTGTVKDAGKKRNLSLNLVLLAGSETVTFSNTLTAKAPKK
jgi:hypothetical protein